MQQNEIRHEDQEWAQQNQNQFFTEPNEDNDEQYNEISNIRVENDYTDLESQPDMNNENSYQADAEPDSEQLSPQLTHGSDMKHNYFSNKKSEMNLPFPSHMKSKSVNPLIKVGNSNDLLNPLELLKSQEIHNSPTFRENLRHEEPLNYFRSHVDHGYEARDESKLEFAL